LRVYGLGHRNWDIGFTFSGLGLGVKVYDLGFRVLGLGFRV
jgi:hypothetical protein